MKKSLLFFVLIGIMSHHAFAQQQYTGKVVDDSGLPLPDAYISVNNGASGASTDEVGSFTATANAGDSIEVSFPGLATAKRYLTSDTEPIIIKLSKDESNELNQVVVMGYGSTTKKDATGAVDAISAKSFDQVSAPSPAQLMRGKVAGVQVASSSGEPGAGVSIRVRGNSSIRSGNDPLIVIDGVPLGGGDVTSGNETGGFGSTGTRNPLNFLNQNDIESISILKDASSTAIYGSRGSNGVILITTKKGSRGEAISLTYSTSLGVDSYASSFDVMSTNEFSDQVKKLAEKDPSKSSDVLKILKGGSYNWKDAILRTAYTKNHDLSISGSTKNTNTRVSVGANLQQGILKNTAMDKYTVSFSNQTRLFKNKLKIDSRVLYTGINDQSTLTSTNASFIGNMVGAALYWNPTLNTKNDEGNYNIVSNDYLNPVELLNAYKENSEINKLLANMAATFSITEGLSYKFLYGIETSNARKGIELAPTIDVKKTARVSVDGEDKRGLAALINDNRLNKTIENTLNYNTKISELSIDALAGYSYYQYNSDGNFFSAKGFNEKQTNLLDNLEGVTRSVATAFSTNSYREQSELESYFGRVVLKYDKILATVTARSDGSTKPGIDNRRGFFPSVGLGYKIVENQEGIVNDLKARLNWGITGNQEFPVNSSLSKSRYNNINLEIVTNGNSELKWETTTSYGLGIDYELLGSKISGSVDYFQKNTNDLIFPLQQATTQPGPNTPRFVNLDGMLINNGVEFSVNYNALNTEDINWDVSFNTSYVANVMKDFGASIYAGQLFGQGLSNAFSQIIENDKPIYSYFMYEFAGYDAKGNSQYLDSEGNVVGLANASLRVLDKQSIPKIYLGFSTSFSYKEFDVSTSFYGAFGHYIYNNTANAYYFRGSFPVKNVPLSTIESGQSSSDPNSPSTKFLEKGDFLRWSNLTVGYNFEKSLLEPLNISSARIYASANNLYVFTSYSGFDPEVNTSNTLNGVPSVGIDYLSYPRSRGYTLGLNLSF